MTRHKLSRSLAALLLSAVLLGLCCPALAAPETLGRFAVTGWTQHAVAPGVTETALTLNTASGTGQVRCCMLEADLKNPAVSVKIGYRDGDGAEWGLRLPEDQAAQTEAKLRQTEPKATVVGLVNASFYNMANGENMGLLFMDGTQYHPTDDLWTYLAVFENGSAQILHGGTPVPAGVVEAASGKGFLIRDGEPAVFDDNSTEPRTAAGVRADGTLVLLAADGRQSPGSTGLKLADLAAVMQDLGCVDAVNFDGGGSTVFMTRRPDDTALLRRNVPSGGHARPVASTVMIVSTADAKGEKDPAAPETHAWIYDQDAQTLLCADCGETRKAEGFTGFAALADTEDRVCLIAGKVQTGWFAWGDEMLHADENGVLHKAETTCAQSCTTSGKPTAVCADCGERFDGAVAYPRTGHAWDENHVCTVCGKQGRSIADTELSGMETAYALPADGSSVRPWPTLTADGKKLQLASTVAGQDGVLTWENNWRIGTARVVIHGLGDYYGHRVETFRIVPPQPRGVVFAGSSKGITLRWNAVRNAEQYAVCAEDGDARKLLAVTKADETEITLPDPQARLCVTARATVEGEVYESAPSVWAALEKGALPFVDLDESEYYMDAVRWAFTDEITNGTSATRFSPAERCTRAQVVTFLWRAEGCPEAKEADFPFADVDKTAYYYDAVRWAVENGITNGTSETTFSPEATVTRGQFVTFLARCAGKDAPVEKTPFRDVDADSYYAGPVAWAAETGVTNGRSKTMFAPNDPCKRCEVVTFLYRYTN